MPSPEVGASLLESLFSSSSDPVSLIVVLAGLSMIPMILLATTAYVKLSVVLNVLRNALGLGQVPSSMTIASVSLALTFLIMSPVVEEIVDIFEGESIETNNLMSPKNIGTLLKAKAPLEAFMKKHARLEERCFFAAYANRINEEDYNCPEFVQEAVPKESFFSLATSFIISELHEALVIGFTIFLPFLVVDLIVGTILVGMGMMMVSPVSISLPFKILLFVISDGWFLLTQGLLFHYF